MGKWNILEQEHRVILTWAVWTESPYALAQYELANLYPHLGVEGAGSPGWVTARLGGQPQFL